MEDKPLQVLLVEDNPGDARLYQEFLHESRLVQVKLDHVERLKTGLAHLAQANPDAILLDLGLPDSQGLETLLKVHAQAPQVPIVILTGLDDTEVAIQAVKAGAQDYLVKGEISGGLLVRAIRYAIERKRAEEELRRREHEFTTLAENIPDLLVRFDTSLRHLYVNPAVEQVAGISKADYLGKTNEELGMPPEQIAFWNRELSQVMEEAAPRTFSFQFIGADGTTRYFEAHVSPEFDSKDQIVSLLSLVHDITERKQAEESLENNQRLLTETEKMGKVGAWEFDIITLEQTWTEEVYRIHEVDFTNNPTVDQGINFYTPASRPIIERAVQRAIEQGEPFDLELEIITAKGNLRMVHAIGKADLEHHRVFGFFQDITERKRTEEALRASEARFKSLVETQSDLIARSDLNGRLTFVNDAYCKTFGKSREELLGKIFTPTVSPEDIPTATEMIKAVQSPPHHMQTETRHPTPTGIRWFSWDNAAVTDESGKVQELQGIGRDITERKQAEEMLFALSTRQEAILAAVPDILMEVDKDKVYTWANPAGKKFFGEGVLGKPASFYFEGEQDTYDVVDPLFRGGEDVIYLESWQRREDGEKRLLAWWCRALKDMQGNVTGALSSGLDITERKRTEGALQESEARFRSLYENTTIGMYRTSPDGHILMANPALIQMLGHANFEELSQRDLAKEGYAPEYPRSEFQKRIERAGQINSFESAWKRKDGSTIFVLESAYLVRGENDQPLYYEGTVEDITERTQAENKLDEERNLLRTLVDNLPDRVYVKDVQGRKILSNLADWQASGGKTMEDVLGKTDFETYSPELAEKYWALDKSVIDTGVSIINREEPGLDPLGNPIHVLTSKVPLHDGQANIVGLVGIGRDITELKQSQERTLRQLEHLTAMSSIDRLISANFDLKLSLSEILKHLTISLGLDAADILILDPDSQMLESSVELGFRTPAVRKSRLRLGEGLAGRTALERKLLRIPDLSQEPDSLFLKTLKTSEGFVCYFGAPLMIKGQVKGVLEAFHRTPLEPDPEWLDFLNSLAGQTAIAIENATLFESLQRSNMELTLAYDETILGWSQAMDLRDKETEGHTQRVTELTGKLARLFDFDEKELVQIRLGTLLHDIGKLGIPDKILLKPGPLTDKEWVLMKEHPTFAYEMLAPIHYLRKALEIPYCHHEKWDGSGYPRGLKGDQIPLIARIFAVVDVWDALSSGRPYRAAWPEEKVLDHIRSLAGTHFDPQVVKVCLGSGLLSDPERR